MGSHALNLLSYESERGNNTEVRKGPYIDGPLVGDMVSKITVFVLCETSAEYSLTISK